MKISVLDGDTFMVSPRSRYHGIKLQEIPATTNVCRDGTSDTDNYYVELSPMDTYFNEDI